MNRLVGGRLFDDAEFVTEQLIDGLSFKSGKKFPLGSAHLSSWAEATPTGGGQGNQHVLIHRTLVLFVIVLLEVFAKPVREGVLIRLTVSPNRALLIAAPPQPELFEITKRNADQEHPPTKRSCPNGVPHQGNPLAIDLRVGLEVVQAPTQTPSPTSDGSPIVRLTHIRFRRGIKAMDSIFEAIMKIRVYVSVIHCGKGIAPIQNGLDCPT